MLLVVSAAADSDPPIRLRKFSSSAVNSTRRRASNRTGLPLIHGHGTEGRRSVHSIGITRR